MEAAENLAAAASPGNKTYVIPHIFKGLLLFLSLQLGIIRRTADHNFWELFLVIFRHAHT
jgi:hypothetical protein